MTDWQKFFERKFDEAFKDESQERLVVRKIFGESAAEITPRSIIAFINEMVALRLTSREKIPLRYVAIFVLGQKKILKNPVDRILDGSLVGFGASSLEVDAELSDSIAALVYGVPLASASQVALFREIQNSVVRRDTQRLLQRSRHPNFVDVLEQVTRGEDVPVDAAITAVVSFEGTKIGASCADRIRGIWDEICVGELSKTISEQGLTETHRSLLVRISERHQPAFVRYLVRGYAQVEEGRFSGEEYFCALSDLRKCIDENGISIDMFAEVQPCSVNASIFNEFVRAARSEYRKFKVKCDGGELQNFLNEHIQGNLQELGDTSHFSELVGDYDFAPVVESLERRLANRGLTAENVGPFYELYRAVSHERRIKLPDMQLLAALLSHVREDSPSLARSLGYAPRQG